MSAFDKVSVDLVRSLRSRRAIPRQQIEALANSLPIAVVRNQMATCRHRLWRRQKLPQDKLSGRGSGLVAAWSICYIGAVDPAFAAARTYALVAELVDALP